MGVVNIFAHIHLRVKVTFLFDSACKTTSVWYPSMYCKTVENDNPNNPEFSHGPKWAWSFDHVPVYKKIGSDRKTIIYGSKYQIKTLNQWYMNLHGICTN